MYISNDAEHLTVRTGSRKQPQTVGSSANHALNLCFIPLMLHDNSWGNFQNRAQCERYAILSGSLVLSRLVLPRRMLLRHQVYVSHQAY